MAMVRTILGTMEMGKAYVPFKESEVLVDKFLAFCGNGKVELDSAYMYAGGKTEEFIGKMKCRNFENVEIASKANPFQSGNSLTAESVRHQLETSLKRLQVPSIQLFYLHAPDHNTPIETTLAAVNALYEEGKFKEFGLSNFASWEVAEICTLCKSRSWIKPTVYQGMYNCVTRMVEKELFPCLRYFGLKFYAYNPLAGGVLTGKYQFEEDTGKTGHRFAGSQPWAVAYRKRFWKRSVFDAVDAIQKVIDEVYGDKVTLAEASIRWLYHHSMLDAERGDGVIIGSSKLDHLTSNLDSCTRGALDSRVVDVISDCWSMTSHSCPDYMR